MRPADALQSSFLNRRRFLQSVAASATVAAATRCRLAPEPRPAAFPLPDGCLLPPVRVSADREIRTIAGLRPYRPSGFVVSAEKIGDTLVVHNYGHGGGGITLCWGTSKLAVDTIPPDRLGEVGVLGCGAVGLTTARLLQEIGARVTIYTKDLPPNTTSNVAGGQWFPFFVFDPARRTPEFLRRLVGAAEFSYRRYQTMVGAKYGVRWIRNYALANEPMSDTGLIGSRGPLAPMLPELKDLSVSEHRFPGYGYARQFDGMLIEPNVYLDALLDEVRMAGATVRVVELTDREAVRRLPERVLVNCTGPEVQYAVMQGGLYMFPRSDGILLGGTHEEGVWSLEPDQAAKERILSGHKDFFAHFRTCSRKDGGSSQ